MTPWYKYTGITTAFPFLLERPKEIFYAGAELEIEGIQEIVSSWFSANQVASTQDGSLRNCGIEFLLPPCQIPTSVERFIGVHKNIKFIKDIDPFSPRTSTHVHVNCLTLTQNEIKTFVQLYIIFEQLAFNYVGHSRKHNIHCVPLYNTSMPQYYNAPISGMAKVWSKYTALNLIPLNSYGTVEFRHLEGTNNPERFQVWLEFLSKLYTAAIKLQEITVPMLENPRELQELTNQLLSDSFIHNCVEQPEFNLVDNLLDIKLSYM